MIVTLLLPLLLLQTADALPECDQAAADEGIQYAMNQCVYRDYLMADTELNMQWKITAAVMKARDVQFAADGGRRHDTREGHFDSLLEAQRGWLRYRDAHCRVEAYTARGGSIEPLVNWGCKAGLTRERTEQLKALAETSY
jgi:uncharacterized protein YecT (DUF1311 family)